MGVPRPRARSKHRGSPRGTGLAEPCLDRPDAVPSTREAAVFRCAHREPLDQLRAQVLRLDDRIDDELAGKMQDVDVLVVLRAFSLDELRPLRIVLDGLNLVE